MTIRTFLNHGNAGANVESLPLKACLVYALRAVRQTNESNYQESS